MTEYSNQDLIDVPIDYQINEFRSLSSFTPVVLIPFLGSTWNVKPSTKCAFRSYALVDAQLQASILHHVNAVVGVARSEEPLPLVQLDQHHVTAELQEDGLLKVAQYPE